MQIFHVHAKTRRPSPGEQAIIASVATRSEDACPARLQPIHKTKTLLGENDMHVHTDAGKSRAHIHGVDVHVLAEVEAVSDLSPPPQCA